MEFGKDLDDSPLSPSATVGGQCMELAGQVIPPCKLRPAWFGGEDQQIRAWPALQ